MDEATSNLPAPDEVRAQLERMTASDDFNRSPQLGAFLRFVVESVLQGKSDRIKAYTIGVDVLRRDAKFDPQLDPIVRVEATRLRRTIDRYYAGLGADDAIRIDLPRGSYVPTFSRRPALPGVTAHSSTLDRFWSIRLLAGGGRGADRDRRRRRVVATARAGAGRRDGPVRARRSPRPRRCRPAMGCRF